MSEQLNLGRDIRSARENSGYTIADVEKTTRIPSPILKDLEANKFSTSGGATYARGNIRTLAKIYNADASEWLTKFEEITGEVDRPMIDLLAENNVTKPSAQKRNISYKTLGIAAALVVVLSIALPAVLSFTKSGSTNKTSSTPNTVSPQGTVVATKTTGVSVVISGKVGKSWVGIQDSTGAQVFSGQIGVGQSQTFKDAQQLNVTIGNAGAVDLNVNGKDLGTPGLVGEVVHLTFGPNQSNQG
jgi:transcriptional regulator with XRE-family HTH domain